VGYASDSGWLTDRQMESLKKLKEIYDKHEEEMFNGKSFSWDRLGGRRHKIRRERINDSYIVREAINSLLSETENRLTLEKQAQEKTVITKIQPQEPEERKPAWKTSLT
jgi:hypothetical protein